MVYWSETQGLFLSVWRLFVYGYTVFFYSILKEIQVQGPVVIHSYYKVWFLLVPISVMAILTIPRVKTFLFLYNMPQVSQTV